MRAATVFALLLAAGTASASPELAAALGKPLPAPDLPVGTLTVRVIAGDITKPVRDAKLVLEGDGKPRTATTDAAGRVAFTVTAKAHVRVTLVGTDVHTDAIDMPGDAGVRVLVSSVPYAEQPAPAPAASGSDGSDGDAGDFPIDRACRSSRTAEAYDKEPLLGKPLPKAVADKLGAAVRGKRALIHFGASFNCGFAARERASLAKRAAAKDIAIISVMSDGDPKDVSACIGDHPPYPVVLDPPAAGAVIGPLTHAMGIDALPEAYLVDAKGILRFHYIGAHDFASPAFTQCVASFAR